MIIKKDKQDRKRRNETSRDKRFEYFYDKIGRILGQISQKIEIKQKRKNGTRVEGEDVFFFFCVLRTTYVRMHMSDTWLLIRT